MQTATHTLTHAPALGLGETSPHLVVFILQAREFALPLAHVREVLPMVILTPIPQSVAWLAGMFNLRGQLIPIIDLRQRLNLVAPAPQLQTPIIIAQVNERLVGFIVDAMRDVLPLTAYAQLPDELAGTNHAVSGLYRLAERLILVLDLERLVSELPLNLDLESLA